MRLNWSAFKRAKHYGSIEEAEAEINPAKVRRLSIYEVEVESLRGRLRQFSRLEWLHFQWCPNANYWTGPRVDFSPELRAEILELQRLRYFGILNTRVHEFPLWLAALPRLEKLMVRGTEIQKIPADIKRFARLRELELSANDLYEIPVEIARLRHLEYLALHSTFVTEIPLAILQMPRLRALQLTDTDFSAEAMAHIKSYVPHASLPSVPFTEDRGVSPKTLRGKWGELNDKS